MWMHKSMNLSTTRTHLCNMYEMTCGVEQHKRHKHTHTSEYTSQKGKNASGGDTTQSRRDNCAAHEVILQEGRENQRDPTDNDVQDNEDDIPRRNALDDDGEVSQFSFGPLHREGRSALHVHCDSARAGHSHDPAAVNSTGSTEEGGKGGAELPRMPDGATSALRGGSGGAPMPVQE